MKTMKATNEKEAIELAKKKIIEEWNKYCGTPELGDKISEGDKTRRWRRIVIREMIVWEGTPDKGAILIDHGEGWVKAFTHGIPEKPALFIQGLPRLSKAGQGVPT